MLAGAKTVTRRHWSPITARKFHEGQKVDAWDRLPRVRGAKKVATIRITAAPELQSTGQLTDEDWQLEGFDWMTRFGTDLDAKIARAIWDAWHEKMQILYVVRFELVKLVDATR